MNENPDDIEGVKRIAAFCCIDNMSECRFQAKMEGIVQDLEQGVLAALALGTAGAGRGLVSSEVEASATSGKSAKSVGSRCPNSFAGDTPVLMADETSKAIDEVRVIISRRETELSYRVGGRFLEVITVGMSSKRESKMGASARMRISSINVYGGE